MNPLIQALDRVPSQAALARYLGIRPQSLHEMILRAKAEGKAYRPPAVHALKIAQVARVRPCMVRPDLYEPKWSIKAVRIGHDGVPK